MMKTGFSIVTMLVSLWFLAACAHTPPATEMDAEAASVVPPLEAAPEAPDASPETAEAPASEEQDEPLANTLRWTTASEVDNFGFDIYRGRAEEGPFERITGDPIPGAGTTDEPQSYVYKDEEIEAGTEYFYYIESISLAGKREKFSPVIRARAKS